MLIWHCWCARSPEKLSLVRNRSDGELLWWRIALMEDLRGGISFRKIGRDLADRWSFPRANQSRLSVLIKYSVPTPSKLPTSVGLTPKLILKKRCSICWTRLSLAVRCWKMGWKNSKSGVDEQKEEKSVTGPGGQGCGVMARTDCFSCSMELTNEVN